jgi:hypothetical protein
MDEKGNTRQDLHFPNETDDDKALAARIKECVDAGKEITVTVLKAMSIEKIVEMSEQ